jgi:site-specific DNA recombinase
MNEKYLGRWVWNKSMFIKDAETGKRTAVPRPKDDWVVEDRQELQIVTPDLWTQVQDRLKVVRAAYGATEKSRRPRGQAPELYSRHLLSGLVRCGVCGARITVQSSQRKKKGVVYRYGRYRCSFHVNKGPSVCPNSMSIPQAALETALVEKFRKALTPEMVDYLVGAANTALKAILDSTPHEVQPLEDEQKRVSIELSNLVDFVVKGNSGSPRLQEEIRVRERRLTELEEQIQTLRRVSKPRPEVDRCWVETQVGRLVDLLARDPVGARREIQKHIEDLRIEQAPETGERVVRVTGRPNVDGLLGGEEAVRLQLVAGAGFEPATFGL